MGDPSGVLPQELQYRMWEAAGLPQDFGAKFWNNLEKEAERIDV